ncbi:MAG: ferritin [bacterium]|nr:ferritin [bacterium]
MIKRKMVEAVNRQINKELYTFYLYLSMAAYFDSINLPGFSHWLKVHAQDEMHQAMKYYNHLVERAGKVSFSSIPEPPVSWDSPLQVFEDILAHEEYMSECIDELVNLSISEQDHPSRDLLNWFVDHQVEKEADLAELVEELRLIGDHEPLLASHDNEMGKLSPGTNPFFPTTAAETDLTETIKKQSFNQQNLEV